MRLARRQGETRWNGGQAGPRLRMLPQRPEMDPPTVTSALAMPWRVAAVLRAVRALWTCRSGVSVARHDPTAAAASRADPVARRLRSRPIGG